MNKFLSKYLPKIAFFVILILLILHLFNVDFIVVDSTTILLLFLLLLSPYASSIKKLKFGDFEAEIQPSEVRKIGKEVKELPEPEKDIIYYEIKHLSGEILSVLESDHILALAKLRIEIEKLLNKILVLKKKEFRHKIGVDQILRILEKENLIEKSYLNPIKEVVYLCNRAIHGEEVREKDADAIVHIGLDLLDKLYSEYYMLFTKPIKKKIISHKERETYSNARYEIKTVVPILDKPYMNTYILSQEQLNQFLEGYEEYAEFLISIKKILDKK